MTENEIIKYIEHHAFISDEVKDNAIQAIKEVQQYRNMGIVETLKDMYETGYAKGIDDFANELLNYKPKDEEYKSFSDICSEIAEKLKGGAK